MLDPSTRSSLANVQRWFLTVAHQPAVARAVGAVPLAATAPLYDAKKFQDLASKKVIHPHRIIPVLHHQSPVYTYILYKLGHMLWWNIIYFITSTNVRGISFVAHRW